MEVPLLRPVLLDGATGTELQKRGMPPDACTEQWILAHPEELTALQKAYVAAGCQVITAPTLGASPAALARFGLAGEMGDYNRRLVALTRRAAGEGVGVAGDLGPCGWELAPRGEATFESIAENYRAQVEALAGAGVDLYLAETMLTMAEARSAVLAVGACDPKKPVLVSFYCDESGRTPDGTDVLAALIVLQGMGVAAFGLNCASPGVIARQLGRLAPYATVPLLAMPAGGEGALGDYVPEYWALGARYFGGCCGAGPQVLAELGRAVAGLDLSPTAPRLNDPDVIPCASGCEARFITPDVDVGEALPCDPDLLENILEAEEEQPQGALKIEIFSEDDLDFFLENQYAVRDALCLSADVPELLERALREYQGRAFWDGTGDVEPEFLQEMSRKYGLVVL